MRLDVDIFFSTKSVQCLQCLASCLRKNMFPSKDKCILLDQDSKVYFTVLWDDKVYLTVLRDGKVYFTVLWDGKFYSTVLWDSKVYFTVPWDGKVYFNVPWESKGYFTIRTGGWSGQNQWRNGECVLFYTKSLHKHSSLRATGPRL